MGDSDVKQVQFGLIRKEVLDEAAKQALTPRYSIVGSWDNWKEPVDMEWDMTTYRFYIELGSKGPISFQILKDGLWEQTLQPNTRDASPHSFHTLQGPSLGVHGFNWTVGKHDLDEGAEGARYVIKLNVAGRLKEGRKVGWEKLDDS